MDPKKKRRYLIIIAACWVVIAGIWIWNWYGQSGASNADLPITIGPTTDTAVVQNNQAGSASGDVATGFKPPLVFPATNKFDTEVLGSPAYKQLKPFTPVDVTGQLGRVNPFNSY